MSPTKNTYGVIWNDGVVQLAPSWEALETVLRDSQLETYESPELFRIVMQHRAHAWSGTEIDVSGSAYDFLCELERAGMLTTVQTYGKEINPEPRPSRIIDLTLWRTGGRDLQNVLTAMEKDS